MEELDSLSLEDWHLSPPADKVPAAPAAFHSRNRAELSIFPARENL